MKQFKFSFLSRLVFLYFFSFHLVYATSDCIKDDTVFQLHFLNKNWRDYKLYSYENPIATLLSQETIDLRQESEFCITEQDIDLYNWPSQTIFFNQNFMLKLEKAVKLEKARRSKKPNVKSEGGAGVFVLIFKGSRVYGGAINESYAAGYNVPTLFFTHDSDGKIAITIRPLKTFESQMTGYSALDDSLKKIVEKPEIEDFFLKLGKLTHNNDPICVKEWLPSKECNFNFLNSHRSE